MTTRIRFTKRRVCLRFERPRNNHDDLVSALALTVLVFYIEVVAGSALEEYGYEAVSDPRELQQARAQAGRLERAYSQSVKADMRPLREMVSVDVDAYRGLLED